MIEPQQTPRHTIRDDVAGSLSCALTRHIDDARRLLASAEEITGQASFDPWRDERDAWRRRSAQAVDVAFEQEAVHEFLRVTSEASSAGDWEQALADALGDMRTAIELLGLLRSTLIADGVSRSAQARRTAMAPVR
jgi:hypothetical protein